MDRRGSTIDAWLALDPDPATRAELADLRDAAAGGDEAAVRDLDARFAGRLRFGTAGLRAALGAGPMRMNRVVVRAAAAGLVRYLADHGVDRPVVVIGYDARHNSDAFAADTAGVVAAAGGRALLLPEAGPTPLLAFAVRHLAADAGVMCTASHNPPSDNGYKVYLADGAQIVPPADREIAAAIDGVMDEALAGAPPAVAPADDPGIVHLDDAVARAYEAHVVRLDDAGRAYEAQLLGLDAPGPRELSIVYTPLHGVGGATATRVLAAAGFERVHVVSPQFAPDPDFPTVAFPNPEEPGALDLAIDLAREVGADLILANDPDADRLGVAVPDPPWAPTASGWTALTGNEIGALLAEHVVRNGEGADRLVVDTFVSSRLLRAIAEDAGIQHREVLTGFKWVVRAAIEEPSLRFVLGFEEALGYLVDDYVRDKDGISAALAFASFVSALGAEGTSVWDALEHLGRVFGHHATRTWSTRIDGPDAAARMAATIERWRAAPPDGIAGDPVVTFTDYARGGDLPPTDAVGLVLASGARVVLRPSGTEPKVKCYLEVVVPVPDGPDGYPCARADGAAAVEQLRLGVAAALGLAP